MVMAGMAQDSWHHAILKEKGINKARINFTFRNVLSAKVSKQPTATTLQSYSAKLHIDSIARDLIASNRINTAGDILRLRNIIQLEKRIRNQCQGSGISISTIKTKTASPLNVFLASDDGKKVFGEALAQFHTYTNCKHAKK